MKTRTFQFGLMVLLGLLSVVFLIILFSKNPVWIICLLGMAFKAEAKFEALKFVGIAMGGVLIALQALMSYKRSKAMEDTAKAQTDAVVKTEQGQRQDRLKNAIEHLGNSSDSVRLGGAYELFHLAQDTIELRQTVLDILCAHIRRTTSEKKYQTAYKSKPSEEIQSLLTLLFVQDHKIFIGHHINLRESWLNGGLLPNARLINAVLSRVYLRGANLYEAKLQGVRLECSFLQEACLNRAQLQGAFLYHARLHGASLIKAQLQGAVLYGTKFQEAILHRTQLEGVGGEGLQFENQIRSRAETETDLFGSVFEGGMDPDDVESLVEGLPDDKKTHLHEKFIRHIGQPEMTTLPENSGAISGTYTQTDAQTLIDEYHSLIGCQRER